MDLTITLAYTRTTLCCLHSLADNDNTVCQRLSTGDNLASCSATAWLELLHGLSDVVLLLVMVVTVICDSATDHRASPTHTHTHTRSISASFYLLTYVTLCRVWVQLRVHSTICTAGERISNCITCYAENVCGKLSASKWDGKQLLVFDKLIEQLEWWTHLG